MSATPLQISAALDLEKQVDQYELLLTRIGVAGGVAVSLGDDELADQLRAAWTTAQRASLQLYKALGYANADLRVAEGVTDDSVHLCALCLTDSHGGFVSAVSDCDCGNCFSCNIGGCQGCYYGVCPTHAPDAL
jgi:hypothetical protein